MREIKYRGYSEYHKKWLYGSLVDNLFVKRTTKEKCSYVFDTSLNENYDCWEDFIQDEEIEVITESVGQSTGLKDKNGVEIYEGDIVNIRGGAFYQGYWEIDEIFEVVYDKYGFLLKNKDCKESFWIAEEIEVIGNIYENGDLL